MQDLYIDDDTGLRDYLAAIANSASLAVDTEFVREKTYYPLLCLVQIASAETIACVDCLAGFDLQPLFERLLRGDCEWVVHSSRQDLEVVYQHTQRLPARLIDTQVAAGLVGFPPQIGLQDLLAQVLGVELDKHYTRTDWSRRPLPAAAIAYARDDVRSLHALWSELAAKLDERGRRRWLEQDCELLLGQAPIASAEQIWLRLKGLRSLSGPGLAASLALVEWRERRARERDRPRRWILGDAELVAIARAQPQSLDALRTLSGLPQRLAERAGAELLAAVQAGQDVSNRERAAGLVAAELTDRHRLKELQGEVKTIAAELGVYPEVVASKQELAELLAGREPARIATTWRSEALRGLLGR